MLQSCWQTSNHDVTMMVHLSERTFIAIGHPSHPWLLSETDALFAANAGKLPIAIMTFEKCF